MTKYVQYLESESWLLSNSRLDYFIISVILRVNDNHSNACVCVFNDGMVMFTRASRVH